jgi:Flp pilus assembly protein TadB
VLSPMTTVFVLAVLWLIVVVPMVVRRKDERRRERSVDGFGRAMRALGRRAQAGDSAPEVFVPRERRPANVAAPDRRPVPAAQEALMYPVDRSEMSAARAHMMARRRRSLSLLIAGTVIFTAAAFYLGGVMWLLDAPFLLGFAGYVYFLRTQAVRDRERRATRQQRASTRRVVGHDVTTDIAHFEEMPESVVRIDDDDIELHNMDTIDLTGLYQDSLAEASAQRRAS